MPNKMKELREAMHMTLKDAANMLEMPVTTYRQYEIERNEMSIDTLIKVADFYDITVDELLLRKMSPRYVKVSIEEQKILQHYRTASQHDKRIIRFILNESCQTDVQKEAPQQDHPPKKSFQEPLRFANRGAEGTDAEAPTPELLENLDDLPDVPDEA